MNTVSIYDLMKDATEVRRRVSGGSAAEFDKFKFALLIIQECMKAVEDYPGAPTDIKAHFDEI